MSLINREALYEKACDLEAQALAYVNKIANDKTKIEEWKIWSVILVERTAFKYNIFDAPEEKPKLKWISVSEKLPEEGVDVFCKTEAGFRTIASYGQLYPNDEEKGWITAEFNRFQTNFFAKWRPIIEDDD